MPEDGPPSGAAILWGCIVITRFQDWGTLTLSGDFADVDAVGCAFGAFVRLGVVLLCSEACA